MRFLFDNNLSHKLVHRLKDIFPDALHVMDKNLDESDDETIWEYVKTNDL